MNIEYGGYSIESLRSQRYFPLRQLGEGGMARVYLAWDEEERREVAIKILREDMRDQKLLDRFMQEGRQVARLRHPHIVQIYEPLQVELNHGLPLPYIVMEYARGQDLQRRLESLEPGQPLPLPLALFLFRQTSGLRESIPYARSSRQSHISADQPAMGRSSSHAQRH